MATNTKKSGTKTNATKTKAKVNSTVKKVEKKVKIDIPEIIPEVKPEIIPEPKVEDIIPEITTNVEVQSKIEPVVEAKVEKRWKPDLQRVIGVKNISKGKLIYKSKRQVGYTVIWDKKDDMNYIEFSEFINLKNSDRRFVTEPWIRIIEDDEVEILKYAQILDNYKEILGFNNMDEIFNLEFTAFQKKFDKLPIGYKKTVTEMASKMIKDGQLDSIKIKNYIEKEMETDLEFFGK